MSFRHVASTLSLALLLTSGAAVSQESRRDGEAPPFTGTVEVTEVLLDVLVTDGDGNVVIGLGPEDFVVEEDGEAVAVESVSFYSNRSFLGGLEGDTPSPGGLEAADDATPQDRYFVLFFYRPPVAAVGNDPTLYLRLPEAGERAFEWIVEDLSPSDHVAVVTYGRGLELHHDFSRDRERLGQALELASRGKKAKRWPSRTEAPQEGLSLAPLFREDDLRRDTDDLHDAVAVLARALGEVPGRKNLILFGADFPRLESPESRRGYEPMVEALNANNVAVYGLSVTGRGRQPSLAQLSEDTGGTYAYRFASFQDPLRRISRENSGYYLVSFERPRAEGDDDGYRPITVKVKNDAFEVRTRSGYRVSGS